MKRKPGDNPHALFADLAVTLGAIMGSHKDCPCFACVQARAFAKTLPSLPRPGTRYFVSDVFATLPRKKPPVSLQWGTADCYTKGEARQWCAQNARDLGYRLVEIRRIREVTRRTFDKWTKGEWS